MTISFDSICEEYRIALEECSQIIPLHRWAHQPKGVQLTKHKTKYGMATNRGEVFISHAFINTTAYGKLKNTLRHELAHLAVGIKHGHNRAFKHVAHLFDANKQVEKSEVDQVHGNIPYKWELIAHLNDGRALSLGGRHRKSRSFTDYPDNRRLMTVDGVPVRHFSFVAFEA